VRRWSSWKLLLLVLLLAACGSRGLSRDHLYDRYVGDLAKSGVPQEVARCVIDHLFDPMSDEQLKAFNKTGDELTAEQTAQVRQLAALCATATST
jgi:hypothetical protein